jgi:Tfp pilus assembly protein PilF
MKLAMRLLLPGLLAIAFVAQLQRSADLTRAQHLLWSVERRTMAMMRSGSFDKVKLRGNIEALNDAQRLDPAEIGVPTLIGSQHLLLGEPEAARRAYQAANRLESRPEIILNLGKVGYSQGWPKRAVHFFSQAVLLDPRMMKEVPEDFREKVSDALRSQDDPDSAYED